MSDSARSSGIFTFECPHCPRLLFNAKDFEEHVWLHLSKKYPECKVCKSLYSSERELEQHLTTHSSNKKYKCEYFAYSAETASNLDSHLMTDEDEDETVDKPFPCGLCEYSADEKSELIRHMNVHREIVRCMKCFKSYTCYSLKYHVCEPEKLQ